MQHQPRGSRYSNFQTFSDLTSCRLASNCQLFGDTCFLHLQDQEAREYENLEFSVTPLWITKISHSRYMEHKQRSEKNISNGKKIWQRNDNGHLTIIIIIIIIIECTLDDPVFGSLQGQEFFSLPQCLRRNTDQSPSSSAEARNQCSYTSTPLYGLVERTWANFPFNKGSPWNEPSSLWGGVEVPPYSFFNLGNR
jgi:hypothetical protein